MDVMAVFCIICSPIHVMLCKSELQVDGCNLRGSLAYVYLRSSFVHSEDKAQSREPVSLALAQERRLSVWSSPHHPPPGLSPPARRGWRQPGEVTWLGHRPPRRHGMLPGRLLTGCSHHGLPQNGEWIGTRISEAFFWGGKRIAMCMLSPNIHV